jgi:AraC-like DNA-binding protein
MHSRDTRVANPRSDEVKRRVQEAITLMSNEIMEGNGVYPHKRGRISLAEISRRANIHPTTFYTKNQAEVLDFANSWLDEKKLTDSKEIPIERLSLAERVTAWAKLYAGLQQSHRDTELDLQQAQAELAELRHVVEKSRLENEKLVQQLSKSSGSNIFPILGAPIQKP